jgi:uncharacterized protein
MGMEAYQCKEIKRPQNVQGESIKSQPCHVEIIADFMAGFTYDGFGKTVSKESQIPSAQNLIKAGNLFLWAVDCNIVSMANIAHRSPRHARINSVFTPPEQRKNGYGSALVSDLCSYILEENLIPILFADIKNPDSNKVYKSIGFKECGRIDNIIFNYK